MTAVGALDDCVGAVSLFATDDLRCGGGPAGAGRLTDHELRCAAPSLSRPPLTALGRLARVPTHDVRDRPGRRRRWSYVGSLFSQLSQNLTLYAQCLPEQRDWDPADADAQQQQGAPAGSRDFGGRCDQFGAECRMWEQPDWLTFDEHGVIALKYSDQVRACLPRGFVSREMEGRTRHARAGPRNPLSLLAEQGPRAVRRRLLRAGRRVAAQLQRGGAAPGRQRRLGRHAAGRALPGAPGRLRQRVRQQDVQAPARRCALPALQLRGRVAAAHAGGQLGRGLRVERRRRRRQQQQHGTAGAPGALWLGLRGERWFGATARVLPCSTHDPILTASCELMDPPVCPGDRTRWGAASPCAATARPSSWRRSAGRAR